jgi:hypothetical protein
VAAAPHARRRASPLQLGASAPVSGPRHPAERTQILDLAERFYAHHAQPAVFQVSPAELHHGLDRELAVRGYRRQAPTLVLTTPINRIPTERPPAPGLAVSVDEAASPRWLTAWTAIEARADAEATSRLVLARIGPRTGFLTAAQEAEVLGVAILVVERGWAGVFCMASRPEARRRGVATAMLRQGAGWPPTTAPGTSTCRSRRATSRLSGSTPGSASNRPTTTTTGWRQAEGHDLVRTTLRALVVAASANTP